MNRYRLTREINSIRTKLSNLLNEALGEWYTIKVYASADHVADRLIDRATSIKKDLVLVSEIIESFGKHYSCNLLGVLSKSESMERIVLFRRVNGKRFAVAITAQMSRNTENSEKPEISVAIRTVMPDYGNIKKTHEIAVDYKYPKIHFEYDGFRRCVSRLTRLIQSPDCPAMLKVLRV